METKPAPRKKKMPQTYDNKLDVSQIVSETLVAYKKPKVHSNAELAERLSEYFNYCAENNVIPTVEEMCLYTGYAVSTVWDWEHGRRKGFSDDELNGSTAVIIQKAKSFLSVFDSKLVVTGKMNPVTYIFRAKNYYGMSDKQEIEVTKNDPLGDNLNEDELAQKLMKATSEVIDVEPSDYEAE